jgi:hypothetical protein
MYEHGDLLYVLVFYYFDVISWGIAGFSVHSAMSCMGC